MNRSMLRRALLVTLLSTAAIASAAVIQDPGSETWTEPSGAAAPSKAEAVTDKYYGIQALKVWQFDERPCAIELGRAALNAPRMTWVEHPLKVCKPRMGQSWEKADVGTGRFVTKVAVCTGDGGGKVQGVALWGAALKPDGSLEPGDDEVKLEFGGCKKWQDKAACPAGSIATGVRGYFEDEKEGLVGIALRCHRIVPRKK